MCPMAIFGQLSANDVAKRAGDKRPSCGVDWQRPFLTGLCKSLEQHPVLGLLPSSVLAPVVRPGAP